MAGLGVTLLITVAFPDRVGVLIAGLSVIDWLAVTALRVGVLAAGLGVILVAAEALPDSVGVLTAGASVMSL